MAVGSLYLAWRNRDVRKFLAGAFFVSSGILFYLYLADVSVPLRNEYSEKIDPTARVDKKLKLQPAASGGGILKL